MCGEGVLENGDEEPHKFGSPLHCTGFATTSRICYFNRIGSKVIGEASAAEVESELASYQPPQQTEPNTSHVFHYLCVPLRISALSALKPPRTHPLSPLPLCSSVTLRVLCVPKIALDSTHLVHLSNWGLRLCL